MNASDPEKLRMPRKRSVVALRLTLAAAGLILIFILISLRGGSKIHRTESDRLRILRTFSAPLREISGLSRAGQHIFAVGDNSPQLGIFNFSENKLQIDKIVDFTAPLRENYFLCARVHNSICRSLARAIEQQWEGLYYDAASDTVQILQESTGSIFVFDRNLDRILQHTVLDFFPEPRAIPTRDGNSLGEGFLPLANGHVLVAKEKFPTAIIEFGAHQHQPQGYHPQRPVPRRAVTAAQRTLSPLHHWHLPVDVDKDCDLSDIAAAENGELYGLSQTCGRIFHFAALDPREEYLQIVQSWQLSHKIKTPEALAIIAAQVFLVASDVKTARHNLWLLATDDYRPTATVAKGEQLPAAAPR